MAVVALALFLPSSVTAQRPAQSVVGTVTEAGAAAPVDGAMVVLLDGERVASRTLTDARGRFALEVPEPGRYELRVDRIGYASSFSGPFDVPSGQTVQRSVTSSVAAVVLAGLDVSAAERCDDRSAGAVAVVWDEVRKALEAATWTENRELYRMGWVRWVRELADDGERVLDEQRERRRVFTPRAFAAADPDSLALHGFVREVRGRDVFSAPDAHVLLSRAFLDGHCFRLEAETLEEREVIGLRFEPLDGRRLPDVRGVLWLDAHTRMLEKLEYEYVNLGRTATVRGDDAHGSLRFRALPNGTWIVEEWKIRMPRLVDVRDDEGRTRRYDVSGYVEEGGAVTSITGHDGAPVDTDRAAVVGTVTDSVGSPAAGVRITVSGTGLETTTDSSGTYRIDEIGEGSWALEATERRLTAYGHGGTRAQVVVRRDAETSADLRLPSLRDVAVEVCRTRRGADPGGGVLLGRVLTDGRGVAGAEVRVTWTEYRGAARRRVEGVGIGTDAGGTFTLCGVPLATTLTATASTDDGMAGSASTQIAESWAVGGVDVPVFLESRRSTVPSARPLEVRDEAVAEWLRSVGVHLRRQDALLSLTDLEITATGRDRLDRLLDDHPRLEPERLTNGRSVVWLVSSGEGARGGERCPLDVYLNGSLVRYRFERAGRPGLDATVLPSRISALEVFEGTTSPVGTLDSCGALLLWVDEVRTADDMSFAGSVNGRVTGTIPDGERAGLRLLPGAREAILDDEGRFDFGPVPPARYTVEASVPGWGTVCLPVEVRLGSGVELEVAPMDRDGTSAGARAGEGVAGGAVIRCAPPLPR